MVQSILLHWTAALLIYIPYIPLLDRCHCKDTVCNVIRKYWNGKASSFVFLLYTKNILESRRIDLTFMLHFVVQFLNGFGIETVPETVCAWCDWPEALCPPGRLLGVEPEFFCPQWHWFFYVAEQCWCIHLQTFVYENVPVCPLKTVLQLWGSLVWLD